MLPSTILFDLDGTLTDPGAGIANAVARAVDALSLDPLDDEQVRGFIGPPLQDAFASLGLTPAQVSAAVGAYREYYGETGLFENEVYEGIPALLDELSSRGLVLAVATSKPTEYARRILDHFELSRYFTVVLGPELDGTRRHKHEIIPAVLAGIGDVAPGSVVMVGDREHDVAGAAKVRIPCIGVTWGYGTAEELEGAVGLVDTPAELLTAVTGG